MPQDHPFPAAGAVVVTGFRAFPGVPDNPSQRVIEHLHAQPGLSPAGTHCLLLDVDYRTIGSMIAALVATRPKVLLLTGYSARARGITLESRATTACAPDKPDIRGHVPAWEEAPAIDSPLDLSALAELLQAEGIAAEKSSDAGQYLCNFSYRRALEEMASCGSGAPALFVHLPAIAGTPAAQGSAAAMPLERMARAVGQIAHWLGERAGQT